jgi:hypothetical protein
MRAPLHIEPWMGSMTVKEILENPPPGAIAEAADFLLRLADKFGWTPADAGSTQGPIGHQPPDIERRLMSVTEAQEVTGIPERTVRAHARKFADMAHPPVFVDRHGARGAYRIDLDEYRHWAARPIPVDDGPAPGEGLSVDEAAAFEGRLAFLR